MIFHDTDEFIKSLSIMMYFLTIMFELIGEVPILAKQSFKASA